MNFVGTPGSGASKSVIVSSVARLYRIRNECIRGSLGVANVSGKKYEMVWTCWGKTSDDDKAKKIDEIRVKRHRRGRGRSN